MRSRFPLRVRTLSKLVEYTKECGHVKKIIMVKPKEMLRFDGKKIQALTEYLNHLEI